MTLILSDVNAMVTPHIALKPKNKKRFIILPCFAFANITLLDPIARPAWTIAGIVHGTELLVETPTSASVSSFLAIDPKFHLLPHGQLCSCCPPHTCVPNKEYCQSIHLLEFSGQKVLLFSGCATPKESINRISEENFGVWG